MAKAVTEKARFKRHCGKQKPRLPPDAECILRRKHKTKHKTVKNTDAHTAPVLASADTTRFPGNQRSPVESGQQQREGKQESQRTEACHPGFKHQH